MDTYTGLWVLRWHLVVGVENKRGVLFARKINVCSMCRIFFL